MSDINPKGLLEEEIVNKLLTDNEYFTSVIPYLKPKYFSDAGAGIIVDEIIKYNAETSKKPNVKDVILLLKERGASEQKIAGEAIKKAIKSEIHADNDLLLKATEKFIKQSIFAEAVITGAEAMGENDESKMLQSYDIAETAMEVTLDEDFGLDFEDIDERIEYYQDESGGLLTGIKSIDKALGKGIYEESLTVFLAPPGVGKSAAMVDFCSRFAQQGRDVVIFSLEMREEEYWKRLDANLLDIDIYKLEDLDPLVIRKKAEEKKSKIGKIFVKEFPSYSLTAPMINSMLDKLEIKEGIKNPIVFVDYLQLMASSRLQAGRVNSYEYIKSITAELRGVAQKRKLQIFTASQLNRSAVGNIEAGGESVADSMGINAFADSMIFLLQTKEMKEQGNIIVKFEKNRYAGVTRTMKLGFNYNKMRFEDMYYADNWESNPASSSASATTSATEKEVDALNDLFTGALGF
jgi:replicative DNA helicase